MYIQGVSSIYIVLGLYTDGEVSAIGAYTNKVQAMNYRDRLLDSMTPGDGVFDYRLSTCVVKEPK